MLRVGDLIDLDETAQQLVAAGYQRVDQVEDRGQFAIRGGLLDVYPATEERAVRVDMFDIEIEALRWFSHLHPAQPGGDRVRRDLARGRARARAPRAGRDRRDRRGPPGHRRAAAGRALPRPAGADPRAHAGDRRRRGGRRADAARPLGGRLHGVRRPGRARPLRQPDEDQRGAGRAGRGAVEQHQRRPVDPDPRPGRRLRRAQPARGRVRAREARAQRLHDGRRLAAARRRRARRVQPRPHQGVAERRAPAGWSSPRPTCATASSRPASSSPPSPSTG